MFRGNSTVQFCGTRNVGLTVADWDGDIEATVVVALHACTVFAINYDAVLLQAHVVRIIQLLY